MLDGILEGANWGLIALNVLISIVLFAINFIAHKKVESADKHIIELMIMLLANVVAFGIYIALKRVIWYANILTFVYMFFEFIKIFFHFFKIEKKNEKK